MQDLLKMKLSLSILVSASICSVARGFTAAPPFGLSAPPLSSLSMASQETPCDVPTDVVNPDLASQKGSGNVLRSATLTDVNDNQVLLGDKMGSGTSLVIFLRHMG